MVVEQLQLQFNCKICERKPSQISLEAVCDGHTRYFRVLGFLGWKATWREAHSLALSKLFEVKEQERAPALTVVLLGCKITTTAVNMGIEARRCRVVPLRAHEVACLHPLDRTALPCRIERRVAAQLLKCSLEEVASCSLLLATDTAVRLSVLGGTVGDLVMFQPHLDIRLLTYAPIAEISAVREP
jgi:hypothetical protein